MRLPAKEPISMLSAGNFNSYQTLSKAVFFEQKTNKIKNRKQKTENDQNLAMATSASIEDRVSAFIEDILRVEDIREAFNDFLVKNIFELNKQSFYAQVKFHGTSLIWFFKANRTKTKNLQI